MQTVPPCITGTIWPAIERLAKRSVVDSTFDRTVTMMAPLPVLDDGATDAQVTGLDATHEQFGPFMVMPIVPPPALTPNGLPSPDVSIVALQTSASCVMWNDCPPIVKFPDLGYVVEFASTE